jgi:carboxylesterase type B
VNLALHDQRNALLWIQKFIEGFGGDKANVTLFGESAGSISICSQMLFAPPPSGPLFRRVILMSGVLGSSVAPSSAEDANVVYESFLKKLGIEERGESGLAKLRAVDVQEIMKATTAFSDTGAMFRTVQDKDWYGEYDDLVTWEKFPQLIGKCEWVDEIVLGTTAFEVRYFLTSAIKNRSAKPAHRASPLFQSSRALLLRTSSLPSPTRWASGARI